MAIGGKADARIYSDARATNAGPAAVVRFAQERTLPLSGKAHEKPIGSLPATNEICGLELFPMLAAEVALVDQLRGKRIIVFFGY